MKYHAHIYYSSEQFELAQEIFKSCPYGPLKFYDKKVGPHSRPMIEIQFNDLSKVEIIQWIEKECQGLSTLVHQDTGDDFRDHTEGFFWIGETLPIDFKFFDLVKAKPQLSIH